MLIPQLGANGKYGYATESGKVVAAPEFDELEILPAHAVGARGKKRWQLLWLRNGATIIGNDGRAVRVVNFDDENAKPDTLPHLWMAEVGGKLYFIHHPTGKMRDYWPGQSFEPPFWFPAQSRDSMGATGEFHFGAHRVFRGSDKINFVDTALNEIFSRDFAAAAALSRDFFLLADGIQKLGIGDRSGQICVPLVWENLQPARRAGFFLANNRAGGYRSRQSDHAGMIDATGKIVIDTVYRGIYCAGDDYLIVWADYSMGVVDYAGKWIFPLHFGEITHIRNDFFILKRGSQKANIVNSNGEKQLSKDYGRIVLQKADGGTGRPFLMLYDEQMAAVADENFRILFQDRLAEITVVGKGAYFITRKFGPNRSNWRLGLRDAQGRMLIPEVFDQIFPLAEHLFAAKKGAAWSLLDTIGREILPPKFASIHESTTAEPGHPVVIWARPVGLKTYSAFAPNGQKLPLAARVSPEKLPKTTPAGPAGARKHRLAHRLDQDGIQRTSVLNGRGRAVFALPDSLEAHPRYFDEDYAWAGDFLVVCHRENGRCGLLDSMGKMVLPCRFRSLSVVRAGRLLASENDSTQLLDWQGQLLFSASRHASFVAHEAAGGYLLASSSDATAVISPENRFLRAIPGSVQRLAEVQEPPHLALFFDRKMRRAFWADFASGRIYRE